MPTVVLTGVEEAEAMAAGSSELKYVFAAQGVSERVQALFYHHGVTTLARLSTFTESDTVLREVLKDSMGLDSATSLSARAEVSGVICSYKTAGTRTEEVSKHQGVMDANRQGKPLLGSEYLVMRNAFEAAYGRLEDIDAPARVYIEKRVSEMEAGDMRAESLQSVLNRDQDGDEIFVPHYDSAGNMKLRKSVIDIADPSNPEELRRRLAVMINGLVMIAMTHTNRKELQGVRPDLLHSYVGYLLGEHVWLLIARDSEGHTVVAPHWPLVIKYEFAIRKRAYRIMQESGTPFQIALRESWLDSLTKERSFTTPLAISAATGSKNIEMTSHKEGTAQSSNYIPVQQQGKQGRGGRTRNGKGGGGRGKAGSGSNKGNNKGGGGKGNKKGGKGGGKDGKGPPAGCASKTPDGRSVCFGYNDWNTKCNDRNCWFVHCCGICFSSHPMYSCPGNTGQRPTAGAASETQGKGA